MRTKAAVTRAVLGLILVVGVTATADAQGKKNTLSSRASASRGAATSDQNIKHAKAANSKATMVPAPVKKGGVRTRGGVALCPLYVDNRTELFVDLYTNGDYRGTVAPSGIMEGYVACGATIFYARADLDDGTYIPWGPTSAYVSGRFLWTLHL